MWTIQINKVTFVVDYFGSVLFLLDFVVSKLMSTRIFTSDSVTFCVYDDHIDDVVSWTPILCRQFTRAWGDGIVPFWTFFYRVR